MVISIGFKKIFHEEWVALRKRSWLYWLMLFVLAFAFMIGGCGGGDDDFIGGDDPYNPPIDNPDRPGSDPEPEAGKNYAAPVDFELHDGEEITARDIVLQDNVYILKSDVAYDEAGDLLLIEQSTPVYIGGTPDSTLPDELAVGSVIVIEPTEEYPAGFQRVITGISRQGDVWAVTSEPATMSEIIKEKEFSKTVALDGRFLD
jgi:hypothetical protein